MNGFDPKTYRQNRAREYGQNNPELPTPESSLASSVYKPFYDSGILTVGEEARKQRPFLRTVGEDVLNLALVPSALVATGFDLIRHPIKTVKSFGEGIIQSIPDMVDPEAYKDRPVSNTINTVANISLVGGLIKNVVLNGARTAAITAAKEAALRAGVDSAIVKGAFQETRLFGAVKTESRVLKEAMTESVKANSAAPFESGLRTVLKKTGLADEVISTIAKEVADTKITTFLSENYGKINTLNKVINPLSIFGRDSRVSKAVQETLFGDTEKSAVGKLYGSDVVKQDLPGFGITEEWAKMQVLEKGWADTIPNRIRVIQDWVESNPDYASLSPLERNKHLADYAKTDLIRRDFTKANGGEYILTKQLPTHYTEAMVDFVNKLPRELTNAQVVEKLIEQYGRDFAIHYEGIKTKFGIKIENAERSLLTKAITELSDDTIPVNFSKVTTAEQKFLDDLQGSGYRIGRQPSGKAISQSAELTGALGKEELLAKRTAIGKWIDKLGLSPEGNVEGFQLFSFKESFTEGVLNTFGRKNTILINGAKIPIEALSSYLEKLRKIFVSKNPYYTKFNLADLRKSDLLKFGVGEADATILDRIIRESVVTNPAIVGLGEGLSNFLKTRNNPVSRAYDNFLRWQSEGRFRLNPMFGLQAGVEVVVWGNLWAKEFPGRAMIGRNVQKLTDIIRKQKTPIIEANRLPTLTEESLVLNEVFGDYARQLRDAGTPQELFRGTTEIEKNLGVNENLRGVAKFKQALDFKKKTQDSNILLGVTGFSNIRVGTNIMKAYARRFGMTLEEALDFKLVDGKKVYTNAWIVENMKQATQSIFGYKAGVLTSPLIRTINTIWFPARFQTKTIMQTAEWLGSLHPTTRALVINDWVQMADWMTTEEGQKWKNGNRGLFGNLFNYVFAFEGIGKSVEAVTKGKLFGGNTGLIGGLPFGFMSTILRDLGYTRSDEQINQKTGKPFSRTVVRDTASFSGFVTTVEDILLSMTPSMPFSQATGGEISTSFRQFSKSLIEDMLSLVASPVLEGDVKKIKSSIQRGKMGVPVDFRKRLPNPFNLLAPNKAEASFDFGFRGNPTEVIPEVVAPETKPIVIKGRNLSLTSNDLAEAKAIVFSEVSNRTSDKQKLEARVIINTALNRMVYLRKLGYEVTLTQVLQAPNQYQGFNSENYNNHKGRALNYLDEKKAKTTDAVVDQLLKGIFSDNTKGAQFYRHKKNGEIVIERRGKIGIPPGATKVVDNLVANK